jgi:hypothetical protein
MLVWTGAFIPLWILPSSFAGSEFGSSTSGQAEISVD